MKQNDAGRVALFILSPLLSIPFLLQGIIKEKSRISLFLFICVLGIVEYLYIPTVTNDKAVYYFYYDTFGKMSVDEFYAYLVSVRVDFLFHFLIYSFSSTGVPLGYLFLFMTILTVGFWYQSLSIILRSFSPNYENFYPIFFFLIIVSFSPTGLFSGIRFYFSISLVLFAIVSFLFSSLSFKKSLSLLVIATLFHFSCVVFIPLTIFLSIYKGKDQLIKYIFLVSILFVFIPRNFLLENFSYLAFSDGLESKVSSYLGEDDYIQNAISVGNFNNFLKYFVKTLWVYIAYAYLMLVKTRSRYLRNAFLLVLALSNVFYSAPTVYNRYLLVALGLYIMLLVSDQLAGAKNRIYVIVTLIVLSFNFFGNMYALRDYFKNSLIDVHSLTSITIFLKDEIHLKDIK